MPLIIRKRKCDHITETMPDELHWLPISYRINQKIHPQLPSHLATDHLIGLFTPISSLHNRSHLRSATHGYLDVPKQRELDDTDQGVSMLLVHLVGREHPTAYST